MIEIMNLRKSKPTCSTDFRIDRASVLGNPFPMAVESERDKVCKEYEEYFHNKMKDTNSQFYSKMAEILDVYKQFKQIRLFCWCAPKRCHGETIKKWLETNIKGEQKWQK